MADLSEGTGLALYRIAQEALGNAAKHAGPTRIELRLTRAGRDVVLTVADDGRGRDPGQVDTGGLGLVNMRERARQLGGTFADWTAGPGGARRFEFAVPLRAPGSEPCQRRLITTLRGPAGVIFAATLGSCLAGVLLAAPAHALDPNKRLTQYLHTSWRIQDGSLPAGMFSITQTSDGFLWFSMARSIQI